MTNIYGIPKYKEINPGIFNSITFPFLFGVMFGDIGHGLMLFFAAFFFIVYPKSNELINNVKYLLLLMGIFAIYCGIIYNEFFSFPMVVLDSCYDINNM